MSHWTKVKLKVTDEETLVAALKRMGAKSVQTGTKTISQYGRSDVASVWVDDAVGFKKEADGTYSMIGDFYHSKSELRKFYGREQEFERELTLAYGIEDTIMKMESLGFELTENPEAKVGQDGLIRLEFTSWN